MKKFLLFLILFFVTDLAYAKIQIFSCEPELTALAREIVGDKAKIVTATNAKQNPYLKIEKNNDLTAKMRSADMVFCSGNGLEDHWLPEVMKYAFKPKVKSGDAVLMTFNGISKNTEKRNEARPHLNPYVILGAAARFLSVVSKVDIDNAAAYKFYYDNFAKKWPDEIEKLEEKAKSLKGKKIVVMDRKWDYLIKWLGLEVVAKITDENGHQKTINELSKILKDAPADMIIFSDIEDEKIAFELSRKTKTRAVLLPITTGNLSNTSTLSLMFNNIINRLLVDCSKTACQNFSTSRTLGDYLRPDNTITDQYY